MVNIKISNTNTQNWIAKKLNDEKILFEINKNNIVVDEKYETRIISMCIADNCGFSTTYSN